MAKYHVNLLLFDGAAGAGAAPAAGGEAGGESAVSATGVLNDGTQVDSRLAERMEKQKARRTARGDTPQVATGKPAQTVTRAEEPAAPEPSADDRWNELKKGEFKDQYARDVQAAIQDRFKNQKDLGDQLKHMQPMLDVLMQKAGVDTVDDLINVVMDDDSLYEDAAEEAGMTVSAYKQFKALQDEHEARKAQEEADAEQLMIRQHFEGLARQAEDLKKTFPDFDLQEELKNDTFFRLTAPNSGLSLESAYYAVHHKELAPQAMAYGIQRAKSQIAQSMAANGRRPNEGANSGGAAVSPTVDPRSMTREQREQLKARVRRGEKVIF